MSDLHLNCDCGEDDELEPWLVDLLPMLDQINIALGGHAGHADLARELADRALAAGVTPCLHPGYADPDGFGRRSGFQQGDVLLQTLDRQRAVLPQLTTCKFHGALYTDADCDPTLADTLVAWAQAAGIRTFVCIGEGALARGARGAGLAVVREGFVDRRYDRGQDRAVLRPRMQPDAVLLHVDAMIAQVASVVLDGRVPLEDGYMPMRCDTWCVHGDHDTTPVVVGRLRERWPR